MKNKHLKIGAYSTVVSIVVIAAAVIVNMIVNALPSKFTKFDATGIGIYDLSDDTRSIISDVNEKISLYLVAIKGNEDNTLLEFLNRYSQINDNIKVETIDPAVKPSFTSDNGTAHNLSQMRANSVIAVGTNRDFEIAYSDIYPVEYTEEDYNTYYTTGQMPSGTQKFAGEQAVTAAIDNITSTDLPLVYMLSGHNEIQIGESLAKYIETDNYVTETLNLMTGDGKVPDDADCVVINNPASDISENELESLKSYVDAGGKIVLVTSFNQEGTVYTNLHALESYYGMEAIDGLVMEQSPSNYYQSQYWIVPNIDTSNDITSEMTGYNVLLPVSEGFKISEELREGVSVSKLLTTSGSAFTATLNESKINVDNHLYDGVCVLGAKADVTTDDESVKGSFVWYSSYAITDDQMDSYVSGSNSSLFLKTLGTLCDKKASVSIAAKAMNNDTLVLSEGSINMWSTLLTVIVPLIIVVGGFLIWNSRRKR